MGIWIRSQDKTSLVKVDYFCVVETNDCIELWGNDFNIGNYSTKEKALNVLDYIETFLNEGTSGIFQMPDDEDIEEYD